ncbi:MAG: hypothetical protein ACE5HL_11610 [Terriglobia bacterium]
MRIRTAGLLLLGLLGTVGLAAQEPPVAKPLTQATFIRLVNEMANENISLEEIVAQVRARGIAFQLTPELEEGLKKLEGGDELVKVLTEPATVELHANVPGAEVSVDGEKRDPVSLQGQLVLGGLTPGRHLIQLRAAGYVGTRIDVFLKPGETRRVEVELGTAVVATPGPLGVRVNVQAGTPEDRALVELEFVKDPEERRERLQSMIERDADSPLALLAYGMLQETYLEAEQFDASLAAGEEVLRRDPRNLPARVHQALAYLGRGEPEEAFESAGRARRLVEDLRAAPAPTGTAPETWEDQKQRLIDGAGRQLNNLAYALFVGTGQVQEPARKIALLERFLALFPQSDYRRLVFANLAFAHQQQGNPEKVLEWGGRALDANPDEPSMLVLVADVLSERRQQLNRARELATRLLDLLQTQAEKVRPPGWADEQWAAQKQLWEGLGHSILGYVLLLEGAAQPASEKAKTQQAIQEFRAANPLLQGQAQLYARNLYRLGFAHAKLGELPQAREALAEVMKLETPYRQLARPLLEKVEQRLKRRGR